jgi:hypothetical protein
MPRRGLIPLALVAALATGPVVADEIHLKGAGKITGRIVRQTDTHVEVEVGVGTVTVPLSAVERIDKGRTALDDYDERAARLPAGDRAGWLALAQWSAHEGLATQSRRAYEHVLALDPSDAAANRALGRVEVDGRWMAEDDAYRARGFVRFEGYWMTPDERDVILRERDARDAIERAHLEADARVREAEARAADAEARAREAEATADQPLPGIPLWWGADYPGPVILPGWPPVLPPAIGPRRPGDRMPGPHRGPIPTRPTNVAPDPAPPVGESPPPATGPAPSADAPPHRAVPRQGTSDPTTRRPPVPDHRSSREHPGGAPV